MTLGDEAMPESKYVVNGGKRFLRDHWTSWYFKSSRNDLRVNCRSVFGFASIQRFAIVASFIVEV